MDAIWMRGGSRRALLREGAVVGTGAVLGGLVLTRGSDTTANAASKASERKVLTFLLTLERLQVAFYKGMLAKPYATGELRQYAETVLAHEVVHAAQLTRLLAGAKPASPSFAFGGAIASKDAFLKAAIAVEDLGAAAYDGQIPNLGRKSLLVAAEIVSVESRHAAWIRDIAGKPPAPDAVDEPATVQQVDSKLRSLGISIGGS